MTTDACSAQLPAALRSGSGRDRRLARFVAADRQTERMLGWLEARLREDPVLAGPIDRRGLRGMLLPATSKRAAVTEYRRSVQRVIVEDSPTWWGWTPVIRYRAWVLRTVAAGYADRPGYDEAWRA